MAITILLWIYSTGTRKRKPHSKNRDIPSHHLWGKTPSIVTKRKIEDLRQPYHSKKIHWETIWPPKPPSWLCLRSLSVGSHLRYWAWLRLFAKPVPLRSPIKSSTFFLWWDTSTPLLTLYYTVFVLPGSRRPSEGWLGTSAKYVKMGKRTAVYPGLITLLLQC